MKKLCKKLPDSPGVYFFKKKSQILYIGRATSLRDRVRSYFNGDILNTRGPLIVKMLEEADHLIYRQTDSLLEAIILESALIKKHQPRYNSKEKDNKSFNYIAITDEDYPRVLLVREREILFGGGFGEVRKLFGPFPNSSLLREALKIIRKIFPFRDKCKVNIGKPCFNSQLGLCPGVCEGKIDRKTYLDNIKNIQMFLAGKKRTVIYSLRKKMIQLASAKKFEEAALVRNQIRSLESIQDVALIKRDDETRGFNENKLSRLEAYDVAHYGGQHTVGVMVVMENGEMKKKEYRKFKIRGDFPANDLRSLKEVLERRLNHPEWPLPDLLIVDGGNLQIETAKRVLKKDGLTIPIVGVVKDDKHRPKKILGRFDLIKKYDETILLANFLAHNSAITYHKKLRDKIK